MRLDLLNRLPLICPHCRQRGIDARLRCSEVCVEENGFVIEGLLECSNTDCAVGHYPILAGVPIIVRDPVAWWQNARPSLTQVNCNSLKIKDFFSLLDAAAPDRQHHSSRLGTWMELHYGHNGSTSAPLALPTAEDYWQTLNALTAEQHLHGPALELGCAVGRYTFDLARRAPLAIGVDCNFELVAAAAQIQRQQVVHYRRRRRGTHFEIVDFSHTIPQNVLFMLADALDPPFQAEQFALVAALNLLDNVSAPLILLGQMDALLRQDGLMILGSPYEWRAENCEPAQWLENATLDASTTLRQLLTEQLIPELSLDYRILQEIHDLPWVLRQHDRYWSLYSVHLLSARKD